LEFSALLKVSMMSALTSSCDAYDPAACFAFTQGGAYEEQLEGLHQDY